MPRTLSTVAAFAIFSLAAHAEFPTPYNTESTNYVLTSAADTVKLFKLPEGFSMSLFASEPDVQQPIGMSFDTRGRLWIAENYTYSEARVNFDLSLRDRIVILEDKDNDGRFDTRKVFWDAGQLLSSVETGFGGVWALCPPNLFFIPDRNGDDVPDGPPEIVLDGFNSGPIRHNIANGLRWGPDGWLYGRHGIMANSAVGRPGTPAEERTKLNACVWRYHPVTKKFEVVAEGTTNPWGMDWDENGELFMINTVIGHLWHVIPGAHYRRMYGEDLNSRVYGLIEQHADHFHWDTGKSWTESRNVVGLTDMLGGGHAHSGMMIYQADNWPEANRGHLFTINLHGRRLNQDILERSGSGYVAKHGQDMIRTTDPFFRSVDLAQGPDGGVFMIDWTDAGECHDNDGVHRTSGRIYKFTHGPVAKPDLGPAGDLAKLDDAALVKLLSHQNVWYARMAQRILQERAATGMPDTAKAGLAKVLSRGVQNSSSIPHKLRHLWVSFVTGSATTESLTALLDNRDEHIRAWAVRLLGEGSPETQKRLTKLAGKETSGLVRLALASTLIRLPIANKEPLAAALLAHGEDAADHNMPSMLWYGIESLAGQQPAAAAKLAINGRIPFVQYAVARRLGEDVQSKPAGLDSLLAEATSKNDAGLSLGILNGLADSLKGFRKAPQPSQWSAFAKVASASTDPATLGRVRELSALFGDGRALDDLRAVVLDDKAELKLRLASLQTLIEGKPPFLAATLLQVITNSDMTPLAAQGLISLDNLDYTKTVLANWKRIRQPDRAPVVSALCSRPTQAKALLLGVKDKLVDRAHIAAFHARQIKALNNPEVTALLQEVWGGLRDADADKIKVIARRKDQLKPERLAKANLSKGREVFNQTCAVCHKLYGEGAAIGPDLTGANRDNIDYLLENVVDPSLVVAADYRISTVTLKDDRVLSGAITSRTEQALTLQTATEKMNLRKDDIAGIQPSELSLMPDGLLDNLSEEQIANLMAYLSGRSQVALP